MNEIPTHPAGFRYSLGKLSDAGLAELIAAAAAELHRRLAEQDPDIIRRPAPKPKVIVIDEPPEDVRNFALMIKAALQSGQYIRAAERQRMKEIADRYPAWVARQGLPADSGTGAWRKARELLGAPRAKER